MAWGLTRCSIKESRDGVADDGVLYFSGHMSTSLSCRLLKKATSSPCPLSSSSHSKNLPHIPLSGAESGGNYADVKILLAVTPKNMLTSSTATPNSSLQGPWKMLANKQQDIKEM